MVNVDALDAFRNGTTVSPAHLRDRGLARKRGRIKVLGGGEISKALTVEAHAFSGTARTKIEAAGGSCVIIS